MSELIDGRIILCQPDKLKGCSLCCGLFNFRNTSRPFLAEFLDEGNMREKQFSDYEEFKTPAELRDRLAHICPYQGFLSANKPGCLIHPLSSGIEGRDRSLFASRICDRFFCPAHEILTDEEKIFLIQNIDDWYNYSVAIADPESFSFIYNYVKENFMLPGVTEFCRNDLIYRLVNGGLTAHAENLASCPGIIFCYSIPEYNINKKNFSVEYVNKSAENVISGIKRKAAEL